MISKRFLNYRLFFTIVLVAVLLFAMSTFVMAADRFCSKTSLAARLACNNEIGDDYWIAIGNCNNLSDPDDRKDCKIDAWDEKKEGRGECKEQYEARQEVCEALGEAPYDPLIDPTDFVDPTKIGASGPGGVAPNPYFPLVPGNMWTYKTKEDGVVTETITVEVLEGETIEIEGVNCVVVRDIVYEGDIIDPDNIIEDTHDWYGQQYDGTVWYFGEFTLAKKECEPEELCEGLYTEDGSWKSGYEGAKPGIIMFADPSAEVGTVSRQEFALGEAEDVFEVISFDMESVTVPLGGGPGTTFETDVLKTLDFSPLEPDATENKYYAPGVGLIKEEAFEDDVATGEVVELESINFIIP